MTIEEKQHITRQLYDGCERCLVSPENPFTLDNPDIIVANGNKYMLYIFRHIGRMRILTISYADYTCLN